MLAALFVSSLLSVVTLTVAQTSPSSVFVYNGGFTGSNFTFAINLASDSQDLFFHLNGPSKFSWIAVGTGSEMKNSLMFIAYTSGDGKNVTLSPRVASENAEPIYNSSFNVALLPGTLISNNNFIVNAQCSNCRSWNGGSLNITSHAQNFIYAVGPDVNLQSDDKAAGMQRHSNYGQFTMDLVQATGNGGLPNNTLSNSGAAPVGDAKGDYDWGLVIHMALMLAAFVFLFPMGYLLLRYLDSVNYHRWMQSTAIIVVLFGVGAGVYESKLYNKSKSFDSGHQIIGIVVFLLLFPQWILGYIHHKQYPQKRRRTWITQSHRILGPTLLFVAIVNGGVGFKFADAATKSIIAYAIVVGVIAAIIVVMMVLKTRQKKMAAESALQRFGEVYGPGDGAYPSDIVLTQHASTPAGYQGEEYGSLVPKQGTYVDDPSRP